VRLARNICAVCDEQIYKPVCALCLTDEVQAWLEKNKISLIKEFRLEIRLFLDRVRRYNRMTCQLCRIETETAVCPTCFKERILTWLNKKDKVLAESFIREFNAPKFEEAKLKYA